MISGSTSDVNTNRLERSIDLTFISQPAAKMRRAVTAR
jgi:hypothetical protein